MVKHILFDFDGTLVQSRQLVVELYNKHSGKYGYAPVRPEEVDYLSGLPLMERVRYVRFPLLKLPQIAYELKAAYKRAAGKLTVVDGMADVLRRLQKEKVPVGILSSNSRENIKQVLARNGIAGLERIISGSHLFGKSQSIRGYMRRNRLRPQQLIYVGDEQRDVEACRACGVPIVAVCWGYDKGELLQKIGADYVVNSPQQLLRLLMSQIDK